VVAASRCTRTPRCHGAGNSENRCPPLHTLPLGPPSECPSAIRGSSPVTFASLSIEIPRIFATLDDREAGRLATRFAHSSSVSQHFAAVRARRDHVGPRWVSAGNRTGNNSRNFPRAQTLTSRHGRGQCRDFQSLKVELSFSEIRGSRVFEFRQASVPRSQCRRHWSVRWRWQDTDCPSAPGVRQPKSYIAPPM
jgi:hypothetical protein